MTTINLDEKVTDANRLNDYFATATTPRCGWKVGLECEVFVVDQKTLKSIPYYGDNGVESILEDLCKVHSWEPQYENDHIISLKKDATRITLEPSGQVELSGSPQRQIDDAYREYKEFYSELLDVCLSKNLVVLPMGYQPVSTLEDTQWIPKKRYEIMSKYLASRGKLAHHMMKLTCSVQVNIDYSSEQDFREKFRLSNYLTPVLGSIYANSPFKRGIPSGYLSYRGNIWGHTDNDRCKIVKGGLDRHFSFSNYVDTILNMPMILMDKGTRTIPMHGITMRELMKTEAVSLSDFANHVSFAFFETRLKRKHIELRMFDAQRPELLPSIPALIKGLLYDDATRKRMLEYFSGWDEQAVATLSSHSHTFGLKTQVGNKLLLDLCRDVFEAAKGGLRALAQEGLLAKETDLQYLEPIEKLLFNQGISPAETLLDAWEKRGNNLLNLKSIMTGVE